MFRLVRKSFAAHGRHRIAAVSIARRVFEVIFAPCAAKAAAGRHWVIPLVLDNAVWRSPPGLTVPNTIRLVDLPPCTSELQPDEML